MRILLCQSFLGKNSGEPLVYPLGLSYIASMIKDNHEVTCFDPNVVQNPMKELSMLLDKLDPDVVGVSLRNIDSAFSFMAKSYYPPFVSMINLIKKIAPHCKLVVGGAAFSIFANEIMKRNPTIDFGIVTEGEFAFPKLLENLDNPVIVKNLIFRKDGKLFFTGNQDWIDFQHLPLPSRELFDLQKYSKNKFSMGIQSRRGCSFQCTFCNNRLVSGDFFRLRSPESVVDELENVVNSFGINQFFFADSVFNFPFDYSQKLIDKIIKRKLDISWTGEFSPKFISASYMKQAVKSGCELFNFSSEGASTNSMHFLGKNFGVDSVDKTIALASKLDGATVGYNFLFDLPRYNCEHTLGLARLIPKMFIRLRSKLEYISLSKVRIYPYTKIYDISLRDGMITEKTDILYPVYYVSKSVLDISDFLANVLRGSSIFCNNVCKKFRNGF